MYFSCKHKLHLLVWLEYPLHSLITLHEIAKLVKGHIFSFQVYLLNAVLFLCFGFRNEFVLVVVSCFKCTFVDTHLCLLFLIVVSFNLAWNTTPLVWQFPNSGQVSFWWQLHFSSMAELGSASRRLL